MRIFIGRCSYCNYDWEDTRDYRYCPNCGLEEIVVKEFRVRGRYRGQLIS